MARCRSLAGRWRARARSRCAGAAGARRRRRSILSAALGGALGALLAIGPVAGGAGPVRAENGTTDTTETDATDSLPSTITSTSTTGSSTSTTTTPTTTKTTTTAPKTTTTDRKPRPSGRPAAKPGAGRKPAPKKKRAGAPPVSGLQAPATGAPAPGTAPPTSPAGADFNTAGQAPLTRAPRLMRPFPIVRMAGKITGRGARVERLDVRAPRGARVSVLCRGRACPRRPASGGRTRIRRGGVKRVRLRHMERTYPAGTMLQVFVTAPGVIGKYTRFTIRKADPPARKDLCVMPATPREPGACPPGTSPIRGGRRRG